MDRKLSLFLAQRQAARILARTRRSYPWTLGKKNAFEKALLDLPFRNTDALTIPQFGVVCFDTANPDGVVNPGSAGAGAIAGINQSKGIDPTTGAITNVQTGQSLQVRNEGISRAIVNGATVIGQPLCAQGTAGKVGTGPSTQASGGAVGYGLEAGAVDGDLIPILLNAGLAFSFKQLGTFAAPLTANAGANTNQTHAHGLGYIPHIVIFVGVQGTSGLVSLSAAPDATNITEKSPVASATFIAYVA